MRPGVIDLFVALLVVVVIGARPGGTLARLASNGTPTPWSDNFFGQLGNGTLTSTSMPVQVGSAPVHDAAAAPEAATRPVWARPRLTPSHGTIKQSGQTTIAVEAEAPAGLGAWTVDIKYDSKLLSVASCDAGGVAAQPRLRAEHHPDQRGVG